MKVHLFFILGLTAALYWVGTTLPGFASLAEREPLINGESVEVAAPANSVTNQTASQTRSNDQQGGLSDLALPNAVDCGDGSQEINIASNPPYPQSTYISLTWADKNSIRCDAKDSDNFTFTWIANGDIFTAYGDGFGFNMPRGAENKISLGYARIFDSPDDFTGADVPSNFTVVAGLDNQGRRGEKSSGMLMVDDVLYMWIRNTDGNGRGCRIAQSFDVGATWNFPEPRWTFSEFGFCGFINYGQNYAMPPHVEIEHGNYVYMYTHDNSSAYKVGKGFILSRVPKDQIMNEDAYEFFLELDGNQNPVWSPNVEDVLGDDNRDRRVFVHIDRSSRSQMVYNAGIDRYIWWQGYTNHDDTRERGGIGIFEARQPWGPWSTVYHVNNWDWAPGDLGGFPTKWISEDGTVMHLLFSGKDRLSVRQATLTLLGTRVPTPELPTATPTPTETPIPPTVTPTPTETPTPTNTLVPSTATFTSTPSPTPTMVTDDGPTTPTFTPTPTQTRTPTITPTHTPTLVLESDHDGDGILSLYEAVRVADSSELRDTDGDGIPDYLDADDDGDGFATAAERADPNDDGDPSDAIDTDADSIPNYLDDDDDNDGVTTEVEGTGDNNKNGIPDYLDPAIAMSIYLPFYNVLLEPTRVPASSQQKTFFVLSGNDDVEELGSGNMIMDSDSIDFGSLNGTAISGFRFDLVRIPKGAVIESVTLEVEANLGNEQETNLTFFGDDSDDSAPALFRKYNLSARQRTAAAVRWTNVPEWRKNLAYQTPNLAPILQEIVNREGWESGNAVMIMVSGTGLRLPESIECDPDAAAKLIVTYRAY